jgi:osmotically-inducible protein OsmY
MPMAMIPAEESPTDMEISDAVYRTLERDPGIDGGHLYVTTNDGIVQLTGKVEDPLSKERAAELAETVRGVRAVSERIDLDVPRPEPRHATSKTGTSDLEGNAPSSQENGLPEVVAKSAAHPSDSDIAQAIEDAALYDPRVKSTQIEPRVKEGRVTLLGIVDSARAKAAAESLALHTVGATAVQSLIQVESDVPETDEARQERIESALGINPFTVEGDIHVKVVNGRAILTGSVANYFVSAQATRVAGAVSGVVGVQDHLRVKHPDAGDVYGSNDALFDPSLESFTYVPRRPLRADAQIAADVKAGLASMPYVDSNGVEVRVHGGTVTLSGTVGSWKQRSAATRDAFEGGAAAVHNDLQVR